MRTLFPSSSIVAWMPLFGLSLAACSQPIDPTALADQAALHAREVVHQSGGGVAFSTRDDSGLRRLGTSFNNASSSVASVMPAPLPPGMMSGMAGGPGMIGMPSMMTTEEQFDDTADRLKVWLRERILADTNLESHTDDEAIYLLRPDPTCRQLPQDGDPPGTIPPIDQHCVDQLTRLEVRISLRADGDGVRLAILVGPQRLELSVFTIHSDLLALDVDLPKAYAATQYIDQTLGSDSPMNGTQYEALMGKLRLAVHKDGEKKVTGSYSVLQAIRIATHDANGNVGPDVSMGASDPTLAVTADGVNESLTVKVAVATLDEKGTWDPMGTGIANRDLHVVIGALTGQATFTEASDQLAIKGLGFGDVTVDAHCARLFDLSLNPNDGHRFDLTLSADANDQALAEVVPRFDLALGFHLGAVASELSSPPASYLVDETYGVDLDNGGAAAGVTGAPASGTFTGGLKVTAGTLTISSSKAPAPVVVPAGKCLTGQNTPPPDAHPVLGKLAVVDCP